jgi:ABC-type branched-subunit amino acid transport system ATPase component
VNLLEVRGVSKHFGGLYALSGLDFAVEQGEILSIIGPNGAGKSTVFNVITGLYAPDGGDVVFRGESIVGLTPNQITKLGIARTFQTVHLFPNMTVLENAMVGQHCRSRSTVVGAIFRTPATRREERQIREQAATALAFFGPRLDEPTAGMNPRETLELRDHIVRMRDTLGLTILVIEHDMRVVKGVSDRVVACDYGKKIAEGSYDEVAGHERVIEAYLGTKAVG